MICYKDMTFCSNKECVRVRCWRHRSKAEDAGDMPVAWSDFGADCPTRMVD